MSSRACAKLLALVVLAGCEQSSEKAEAAAIDHAIDRLREAPNEAKAAELRALGALACSSPEICAAQSVCVAAYELHVSALAAVAAARTGALGDAGLGTSGELELAREKLERGRVLAGKCADAQGELVRRFKL